MPSGVRKKRQVLIKVWFSNGGRFCEETTRDLTEEEFVRQLREMAGRLTVFADSRPGNPTPPEENDADALRR